MLDFIISSYVYQGLYSLLEPLWNNPVGRTFLLTAFFYFMSYLIYGSYLSRFAGGVGGLSLSHLGFELSDFINMLPAAILAMLKLIQSAVWPIIKELLKFFLFYILPALLGIFISILLKEKGWMPSLTKPGFILQIGSILYLFGGLGSLLLPDKAKWYRIGFSLCWVLQVVGIFLISASIPRQSPQTQPSNTVDTFNFNIVTRIIWEFDLVLILIFLIFAPPTLLGKKMADISLQEKILSRVSQLILKEALPNLKDFKQNEVSDETGVHAYTFTDTTPLYLVTSFRNSMALYMPQINQQPPQINGKMILIAQELIYSIELQNLQNEK